MADYRENLTELELPRDADELEEHLSDEPGSLWHIVGEAVLACIVVGIIVFPKG